MRPLLHQTQKHSGAEKGLSSPVKAEEKLWDQIIWNVLGFIFFLSDSFQAASQTASILGVWTVDLMHNAFHPLKYSQLQQHLLLLLSTGGFSFIWCWYNELQPCALCKEGKQCRREMAGEWHLSDCSFGKWICLTRSETACFYHFITNSGGCFPDTLSVQLRLGSWFPHWALLLQVTVYLPCFLDCFYIVHQEV